jgi:high-affinity nickel-transport protein
MIEFASKIGFGVVLVSLFAGMRHGVDWDHIAAISDITSTQRSARKGILFSFLYAVGHASVVASIALGLLLLSFSLPESIERGMETVVGLTLVALGVYVLYSLRQGDDFRLLPRWALVANGMLRCYGWLKTTLTGVPSKRRVVLKDGYGRTASYLIGMIHGVGAETPTQMMLFALAVSAGVSGGKEFGALLIVIYSLGLIITNTVMGVLGAYGYVKAGGKHRLYRTVAFFTAVFSMIVGVVFIAGVDMLILNV